MRKLRLRYYNKDQEVCAFDVSLTSVLEQLMYSMPPEKTSEFEKSWTNDEFIDRAISAINKVGGCKGQFNEQNMIYDKYRNWSTFLQRVHYAYSYLCSKPRFHLWGTYISEKRGKLKVRISSDSGTMVVEKVFRAMDEEKDNKLKARAYKHKLRCKDIKELSGYTPEHGDVFERLANDIPHKYLIEKPETKLLDGGKI